MDIPVDRVRSKKRHTLRLGHTAQHHTGRQCQMAVTDNVYLAIAYHKGLFGKHRADQTWRNAARNQS